MELDGEKLEVKQDETADLAFEIVTRNPHPQLRQVTHSIHALVGEGGNVYDVTIRITAVTNRPLCGPR